ncbi:hypothetical protein J1N35_025684 [Gossypium stocksii]|uniref:Uncharacterized protein n=1 Tax=Gossypium stocksii TaxID=47602 RepID=A0A9D3V8C4_9ROSI|nr:hypothetical protein J1N35_025684 [Gossypium stocksii]
MRYKTRGSSRSGSGRAQKSIFIRIDKPRPPTAVRRENNGTEASCRGIEVDVEARGRAATARLQLQGNKIRSLQSAPLQLQGDKAGGFNMLHCNFRKIIFAIICSFNLFHCNVREIRFTVFSLLRCNFKEIRLVASICSTATSGR